MSFFDCFSKSPMKVIKEALKNNGISEIIKETTDFLHVKKTIDFNTSDFVDENLKDVQIEIIIDFPLKDSKTGTDLTKEFIYNMNFVLPIPIKEEDCYLYIDHCNRANNIQFLGGCFFASFEFEKVVFRNMGQIAAGVLFSEETGRVLNQGLISIGIFFDMYFNRKFDS